MDHMEFSELAKKRYSVRSYNGKKVEKEKLEKILEAAHVAPTAANLQPVRLLVIQQEEGLEKLSKAANIYHAPLAIVVCADHDKAWVRPFDKKQTCDIDASILTDHMMLQASELGLGSVWICYFKPDILREEFCIPKNLEPVNILAVGYSKETPQSPDRHEETRIAVKNLALFEHF
nr:nitroreductase family protein [Blautia pseudococcoides]